MQVEFLGVPRQRAGVDALDIDAATLGELVEALANRFPTLAELIEQNRLHKSLAANLNGDRFVNDPATPLAAKDCLLILSADVGG
jgi:molybdopterin converting factor small subunit